MFTAQECRQELEAYKKRSSKYARINVRPEGIRLKAAQLHGQYIYKKAYCGKIARGVQRRLRKIMGKQ